MADNYGTVAAADAYFSARGVTAWTGDDTAKLAALVRASAYIDAQSGKPAGSVGCEYVFPGTKTGGRAQVLAWPRTGAYDSDAQPIAADEVPREIEWATYEAALRELIAPGSLAPDVITAGRVKKEKVDVLEVEYFDGGELAPVVTTVNALLASLMIVKCTSDNPWLLVV